MTDNERIQSTRKDLFTSEFFAYSWHIDEFEKDRTIIRVYGLDKENKNVCITISDFYPYVYVELPNIEWNNGNINKVTEHIKGKLKHKYGVEPIHVWPAMKYKLYYAHLNDKYERVKYPFLMMTFNNVSDISKLKHILKWPARIYGINNNSEFRFKVHESNASPILQLTCNAKIPTSGWIKFRGFLIPKENQKTSCDYEYAVKWKQLCSYDTDVIAKPLVMSFDIEVNSNNPLVFPEAKHPLDAVFQISCILHRDDDSCEKYLLSLGNPENVGDDVKVETFKSEYELLIGFRDFINRHNPNVITGYNIFKFDTPYMITRCRVPGEVTFLPEFDQQGFLKNEHAKETLIKWSSSAYKNQEFEFLNAEGRLFIDLLPIVKQNYKFNSYKLSSVATHFIGKTKADLDPQGIFKAYRVGVLSDSEKGRKLLGECGAYCVQDTLLVTKLFEKLQIWTGLTEMAKVTRVTPFALFTQGQQLKVFSQVYYKCTHENIVVEQDVYNANENDHYVGAKVFPPISGIYEKVIPFDFSSLYPTTIIAYNIDYSTLVRDDKVPNSKCHVIEWEDHILCEHDVRLNRTKELNDYIIKEKKAISVLRGQNKLKKRDHDYTEEIERRTEDLKKFSIEKTELLKTKPKHAMCAKRRFRFLKEPIGVVPSLLKNLLESRESTKQEMKLCKGTPLYNILDKRQLAYKVCANSAYGAMGVVKGFLPFMPGAMCTTAMGRISIEKVATKIPEMFQGQLVYGDTDSNYIHFPHLNDKTPKEIWEYSEMVARKISELFPKPMSLSFEEKIYWKYLILTKKRYMSLVCDKNGNISKDIDKKGVLLSRRDNSEIIRKIYLEMILKIFNGVSKDDILIYLVDELNNILSHFYSYKLFIMTQSIGDMGVYFTLNNFEKTQYIEDENNYVKSDKGKRKIKFGNYKIDPLPVEDSDRLSKFHLKDADNDSDYYLHSLPAQIQLAEKLRRRGTPVEVGTRLEYIVTTNGGINAKKYYKIESAEYFKQFKNILDVDYFYYIKQLIKSVDQVLKSMYGLKYDSFISNQYKLRIHKNNMLNAIKKLNKTNIVFE